MMKDGGKMKKKMGKQARRGRGVISEEIKKTTKCREVDGWVVSLCVESVTKKKNLSERQETA